MDDPDEQQAWLALARVPGLTANALRPAIEAVGSAATLCRENAARLLTLGLPPGTPAALRAAAAHRDADQDWLAATDHHLLTLADAAFPPLLLTLPDAPVALWVRGQPEVLRHPQVAVVGSRHPSPTGREIAHEFAAGLTRAGFAVTSGLALGIDAAAHRGALAAGGYTVAVCGTGLDRVYPTEHASLAAGIAAQGALVSDQPLGTPPLRHNFPHRNRLISGLALGTLVVEAAARSGSLITARLAGEQGRELFAVPGSIRNPLARGCHALLKQGARLVESVDDVLAELGGLPLLDVALQSARAAAPAQPARTAAVDAGADGARLLDALGYEPVDADTLSLRTGLPAQTVSATLLLLELAGQVECTPDGCFSRVPARRY